MSQPQSMTAAEQNQVRRYVHQVAKALFGGGPLPPAPSFLRAAPYGGLFVTLRAADGRLRGCMGRLCAEGPLADALVDVTRSSLHDPRFRDQPVTAEEWPQLRVEVSIVGPLWHADRPGDLVPGVHGVVISQGAQRGCFLPQVASEHGWSMETFLSECCRLKAGLPADAWRDPATQVEAFEVFVIKDADSGEGW